MWEGSGAATVVHTAACRALSTGSLLRLQVLLHCLHGLQLLVLLVLLQVLLLRGGEAAGVEGHVGGWIAWHAMPLTRQARKGHLLLCCRLLHLLL